MKGVQCYELFGGIAVKNHAFSFSWRHQRFISSGIYTPYAYVVCILHDNESHEK